MLQVSSSILAADFADLARDCRKVVWPGNPMLHFDVMDGLFVPNLSVGLPVLQSLVKALPEAIYDVHLMICQPHRYVEAFAAGGADTITIHYESDSPVRSTLRQIRALGKRAGLSLRPGTAAEEIFPLLDEADMVLVMSVEPGFGGQSFMPEAPARIAAIKAEGLRRHLPLLIEVDGGINAQTGPLCAQAGAHILVAGNSVFRADDPYAAVCKLKEG